MNIKQADEILNKLSVELLKIEENNLDYFKKRAPKNEFEKYERLHNHWISFFEGNIIEFGIIKNSDLPEYIKQQCIDIWNKIFKEYN